MPEFYLNDSEIKEFTDLPEIVQGYLEAMFFTECGGSLTDDSFDPENGSALPDEASWLEIDPDTMAHLIRSCTGWADEHDIILQQAYDFGGDDSFTYDEKRAGNDLWYTSNGHGVGFWDRGFPKELGKALSDAAREFGEATVGWETTNKEECTGVVYID